MKTIFSILFVSYLFIFFNDVAAQSGSSPDLSFTTSSPTCYGKNDGSITILNSNTGRPYKHQIVNTENNVPSLAEYTSDNVVFNLSPGTYVVWSQYTDTDGQLKQFTSKSLIIKDIPKLEIKNYNIVAKPTDQNPSRGMISLEINGGTSPYSIVQISPSETLQKDPSPSPIQLNQLKNDIYTFNVSDNNHCPTVSQTIQVPKDNGLTIAPKVSYPPCSNTSDGIGKIDLLIKNGTAPYMITYTKVGTGTATPITSDDGSASINFSEYGEYSFNITDQSIPQKSDNALKVTLTQPNCVLSFKIDIVETPTASNQQGGKIKITINSGKHDYKVSLKKGDENSIDKTYSYDDFFMENLTKGNYVITITDSKGATDSESFSISPVFQSADNSRQAAITVYNRFLNKYAQIEVKRKRTKDLKNLLSLGVSTLTSVSALLTAGTTQIISIGLNIVGNGIVQFTNNDNYEALTRASQLMRNKLNVEYIDSHSPYYDDWNSDKYQKLLSDLQILKQTEDDVDKIDNMPDLRDYKESVKKRRVPEYSQDHTK